MRNPSWPFTHVLEKIRREVTRKMQEDRRVALQGVLGHGRSRANAARARLVRANAQSQSDSHDSERAEIATRTICHLVRSSRRLPPRLSASACGTAVVDRCKLFEELVYQFAFTAAEGGSLPPGPRWIHPPCVRLRKPCGNECRPRCGKAPLRRRRRRSFDRSPSRRARRENSA